jgi:hypothetical protein
MADVYLKVVDLLDVAPPHEILKALNRALHNVAQTEDNLSARRRLRAAADRVATAAGSIAVQAVAKDFGHTKGGEDAMSAAADTDEPA